MTWLTWLWATVFSLFALVGGLWLVMSVRFQILAAKDPTHRPDPIDIPVAVIFTLICGYAVLKQFGENL